jgi:hypothetical protein
MVNRNHKLMLFCFFYGATAADQLAESTLKSEYRAGGDSLISTDSEECRTVQSHVGLPRWLPPLHEKDTATYSPPVQILHKQRDPIPKTTNRVLFKKNPIVFLVREEKKTVNAITFRSTCPTYFYRPFLPIRILQSKIPICHMWPWSCISGFRFS